MLGLVGGLAGAALGIGGAKVIPHFISKPSPSRHRGRGFHRRAVAIGLIFGVYPASRAARMAPIDALRSD